MPVSLPIVHVEGCFNFILDVIFQLSSPRFDSFLKLHGGEKKSTYSKYSSIILHALVTATTLGRKTGEG